METLFGVKASMLAVIASILFLCLGCDSPSLTSIDTEQSVTIDAINSPRLTDQVVLYDHQGQMTSTNEFGFEVVVADGRIVKIGGNNNEVPVEGYVLSAHGKGKSSLQRAVVLGASVHLSTDRSSVTFTEDIDQRKRLLVERITNIGDDKIINGHKSELLRRVDIATSAPSIESIEFETDLLDLAARKASLIVKETPEHRVIIHRSTESSRGEVKALLERSSEAGFNTLCIEAVRWGGSVEEPIAPGLWHAQAQGRLQQPLSIYVEESQALNLKLWLWVQNGFLSNVGGPIAKRENWLMRDKQGNTIVAQEANSRFMCYSHREVRHALVEQYRILLEKTNAEGLALDYLRLPVETKEEERQFCYCSSCRAEFAEQFQAVPYEGEQQFKFQRSMVTTMLREIRKMSTEVAEKRRRPVIIALFMVPGERSYYGERGMDIHQWEKEGLVDLLCPMTYTSGMVGYPQLVQRVRDDHFNSPILDGLGSFAGASPLDMGGQVLESKRLGAAGYHYLSYKDMSDRHKEVLSLLSSGSLPN